MAQQASRKVNISTNSQAAADELRGFGQAVSQAFSFAAVSVRSASAAVGVFQKALGIFGQVMTALNAIAL